MTELMGTRRDLRAVSYALCSAVVGVIFMRLVVYFAPLSSSDYGSSLAVDALFSVPTQVLFFLIIPFLIYMFYGKRTAAGVLEFSSAHRRFSPLWLLAFPLGFCVWIVTIGVSSGWLGLLDLMGYNYSSSEPPMPETLNVGFFVAELVMTAVLPAVCEEFIMRGGTTAVMRKKLGTLGCVIFGGIAFGLFHQNIRQVFYTSLFGALATLLTVKLESIYPAMIMHFTNNFCSVFFSYADEYRFAVGGGMLDGINALARNSYFAFFVVILAVAVAGAAIVYVLLSSRNRKARRAHNVYRTAARPAQPAPPMPTIQQQPQPVPTVEAESPAPDLGEPAPVTPAPVTPAPEVKEKTEARDIMILVALAVVTVLTTIFTFVWGLFV